MTLPVQHDLCDDADAEHDEDERAEKLGEQFTHQGILPVYLVMSP